MKNTLRNIAKSAQRKQGKKRVVKLLKQFRKDFKVQAKLGRMSVSYRNLDDNWDALIALRYLRIHSDLRFDFMDFWKGGLAPCCTVRWD